MRSVRAAALAVAMILFVAACSSGAPSPSTSATAASPGATASVDPSVGPPDDEGGNPACMAIFNLLEQLREAQGQYVVAVGADASKAPAAKADVQAKLRKIAGDIRSAAANAPEKAVKDAAAKAAAAFEAGANDPQFFAGPKDEQTAINTFSQATLGWTTELLATC